MYEVVKADANESGWEKKRDKFLELAPKRMERALGAIRLIGNLSNRHAYIYKDKEVRRIVGALRKAVSQVEAQFNMPSRENGKFHF